MIPLEWKASIFGAEDVKQKFAEIRQELDSGQIGIQEYSQKAKFLTNTTRSLNTTLNTEKQIFLATHPVLNTLSKGMATYGRVMSSALSIINAFNIANLVTQQSTQQIRDANLDLIEAQKELLNLQEAGLSPDDPRIKLAKQKIDELKNSMVALNKEFEAQKWNNLVTGFVGIGVAVSTSTTAIIGVLPQIAKLRTALTGLTAVSWAAAGPWGLIIAGLTAFAIGFYYANQAVTDFFTNWSLHTGGSFAWGEMINEYFSKTIPAALAVAWTSFLGFFDGLKNLVVGGVNSIIGALQVLINGFISVINAMIAAYNSVAKKLKLPQATPLQSVTLPTVSGGVSSTGSTSQAVPFTGSAFAGSAGGQVTIIVQGSILAQRELEKIANDALKNDLKKVGFG